nr:mannose-1-phosphate guanylyltransferase/mannose-6-phosphate isomerase [Parendozoicomonas sp. Alg238-R29]
MILPVILSGGTGSRLWPQSRALCPKQFQPLVNQYTLFQNTIQRLDKLDNLQPPMVIANEEHRFLVAEQLRQLNCETTSIVLEPEGRNTAPAVALAAFQALADENDPLLLVLAADHVIQDEQAFHLSVRDAVSAAEKGNLVTFGITPDRAETGYGYIKVSSLSSADMSPLMAVAEFVEKPDKATAEEYVSSGGYYWNSGMFLFRASVYLEELKRFRPNIYAACEQAMAVQTSDLDFTRINKEAFLVCPAVSVDYAVMETTEKAVMVGLDAGWSDIGSWSGLADVLPKDSDNNSVDGDVISLDSQNCLLRAEKKLLACIGLENLVVVETDDAILVADKDRAQEVKPLVENLQRQKRSEAQLHRKVFRPWGFYDTVDSGDRFQVKRLTVHPGASLSQQKHFHRAEHWVVVSGTAKVTCGEKTFLVTENESTFIPIGEVHCLENPGKVPLHLIEVQSGSYLGEDDIVRFTHSCGHP